jgi:hypothetical protein
MTMTATIRTKIGQTRMTKGDEAAAMVRLVTEMRAMLEEAGVINQADEIAIDNVVNGFLAKQTQKVRDEVREG